MIIILSFAFNLFNIKTKTTNMISQITIPFSLIVNPNHIDQGVTPKSIKVNISDQNNEKIQVINLVDDINQNFKQDKKFSFLSKSQQKKLSDKVNQKSHQYISSITLLNFGRDISGKYITISCNQYNDTKKVISYRYLLHYDGHKIKSSKHLGKKSASYPPRFIIPDTALGNDGINQSKSFMQQIKTAIINSNLISNNESIPGDFQQIAANLGLTKGQNDKALYQLTKHANSRLTNFAIIGYELSDVPRYSRIYLKQINNGHSYYYTLTYNRNTNKFQSFQTAIHSNRLANQ